MLAPQTVDVVLEQLEYQKHDCHRNKGYGCAGAQRDPEMLDGVPGWLGEHLEVLPVYLGSIPHGLDDHPLHLYLKTPGLKLQVLSLAHDHISLIRPRTYSNATPSQSNRHGVARSAGGHERLGALKPPGGGPGDTGAGIRPRLRLAP